MLKTITIDTDTQMVVPRELLKKARLCIEDYIEGAPSDGTDEKCMDDISSILAIKQPEQAQQDGTVINYGTMVSDEFLECFNHAFSFLANGHSIGQCFDMMKFARAELIKSMKNKPAPLPVPTKIWLCSNKTTTLYFATEDSAKNFSSSFGASSGFEVFPVPVIAPTGLQRPEAPK